jgi:hypothetical protein
MKKFILFSLVLSALLAGNSVNAQVSGIGLRPMLTLSTYKLNGDYSDTYDAGLRPGLGLALFTEINLGNRFTFQPEIAFVQRGNNFNSESTLTWNGSEFGYPSDHTVTDYRLRETLNYIDIPLMFERNFGGGNLGAYLALGPAFSFAVGNGRGLEQITVEFPGEDGRIEGQTDRAEYTIEMGKGRNDVYRGFDMSLNAGGGLIYIMERGEIGFDLRYSHGLKALDPDGLKNRNYQIGVSYMHYLGQ